jgi:transcriptional regulator with XRE-family HTH domain
MKRDRLILERNKRKLTRDELAKHLGISEVYVRKIESGSVKPGRDTMIKFEEFYSLGMKTLFPDIFLTKNDKKFIKTGTE